MSPNSFMYPFDGWHTRWSHGFAAVNNAELNVSIQIFCGCSQIPLYIEQALEQLNHTVVLT